MNGTRWVWLALFAGVAIITAAHIVRIDALPDQSYFAKYIEFADAMRSGTIARDRIPDLSPAYLWLITFMRSVGAGVQAIRIFQIILLGGVALIGAAIAQRLIGRIAAVAAAILVVTNKAALVNASEIEPETLLLLFCAIGLALVLSNRLPLLFAAGIALGVAAGFRPVALLSALALLVWLGFRSIRGAAVFAVGIAIPVIVLLAVNYSLAGSVLLMDPGTVFYEGMNPNATGYSGVAPRIVKDIEVKIGGSDTMHVAYRIVASRALGHPITREVANRYWTGKSLAFIKQYPLHALNLIVRKARLLVSAHDAYDIQSMVVKDRALGRWWISWGVLVSLAIAGVLFAPRRSLPVAIYAVCAAVSPVAFFVTARHRNPLLIAAAVLGGIAVAAIVDLLRRDRTRALIVIASIAIGAFVLSVDGELQREDDFVWTSTLAAGDAIARHDNALAATWAPVSVPESPPAVLRATALRELKATSSIPRQFSIAVALVEAGDGASADQILQRLQALDYKPFRRTREVSSVAYYRARALLQQGRLQDAQRQIAAARGEAPGDANVLALSATLERDRRFAVEIDRIHDPFTRDWALSNAAAQVGDKRTAGILAVRTMKGCPEWWEEHVTIPTSASPAPR
jgi:hypothetical protein